jgi:hypothetical protein
MRSSSFVIFVFYSKEVCRERECDSRMQKKHVAAHTLPF